MAKLILSIEGMVLKEIPLTKERITIGRKPTNDVQIDNLAISGEHAVIISILNDAFLEDLHSTNGTFVNGQPVSKHFLQNGDNIELGKYCLKYLSEAVQPAGGQDFEKTMILRPGMLAPPAPVEPSSGTAMPVPGTTPMPPAPARPVAVAGPIAIPPAATPPVSAPAVLPLGVIQILSGANAGKQLELTKTLTTLGKPGVLVVAIARRPRGYFITYVEGSSFPAVNGKSIGTAAYPLSDHDVIELTGTRMEFFLRA
ncbi:MAG: FHA domain-containing protein [Rhodocyclales bacterium]|nr:FHA domain-containing protein [Rhodocyclales bacterium]